jgi:hypothetical protein
MGLGPRRRHTNEAGFTVLESTIALSVVFVVLLGLLGALTSGARGLVTGRQRSAGLALANEVMEDARGRAYGDVGHDFDSDPTLNTDPLITGTGSNRLYTGLSPAEPLAGSSVDAGAAGGTVNNPLWPFSPHIFTSMREHTTYTTAVYVTMVTPATGDPYKRVTVKVSWSPAQYATTARSVTLSSFLFNALAPPDPRLTGTGEADAGFFKVTGSLTGISLSDANVSFPYVNGSIDSGFVRSAKGVARSGTSQVDLLSGTLSGCSVVLLTSTCDGAKAQADADNDSGTSPPDTDQEGPNSAALSTITAAPVLTASLGSGTAQAQATARSCWSCQAGGTLPVGDNDTLPYFYGTATGPANVSLGFLTGVVGGTLLSIGTGCSVSCSTVTVDRDDSGTNQRITSTASVSSPAVNILTFLAGPLGYSGMVKIGGVTTTATANAGPGASNPTVTTSPATVTVQYWNGLGYTNVSVNPNATATTTIPSVSFLSSGTLVTASGTITSNKAVTSSTSSGGAITDASAGLNNWLFVDLNVTIGALASLNLHLDYGRIAADADYQPVS